MSRNPFGLLSRSPKEWGRKNRKDEDGYRAHRRRGKDDAVAEAAREMLAAEDEEGVPDDWRKR